MTKKTGTFAGKSTLSGMAVALHSSSQRRTGGVIGAIARKKGAAPGGPNYHGSKKK